MEESRSSGFGRFLTVTEGRSESEEERLNNLFSASYQEKEEQELKEKLETKLSSVLESQASQFNYTLNHHKKIGHFYYKE